MNEVKIKGIYKHYKGDLYLVEDIIYHSETQEKRLPIEHYMEIQDYGVDHIICL